MIIESKTYIDIYYMDGERKMRITLSPGKGTYHIDKNDPVIANQLFVLRKHGQIKFDGLLPKDKELIETIPKGPERFSELAKKVHLKPSPVGRLVNGPKKDKSDGGPRKSNKKISKTRKDNPDSGSTGGIPGEGKNEGQ